MGIRALGLCAALGLASFTAFADYSSATKDLKNEDYTAAFNEFKQLAQQGHAKAMYELARMYELGLGTEEDIYSAFSWYMIALDFGNDDAKDRYRKIRRLVPSRKEGKDHYKALARDFGFDVHQRVLAPVKDKSGHDARYITVKSKVEPEYGSSLSEVQSAWATVGFDVNQQGQVVNHRVIASFPKDVIDDAALEAISQWQYKVPNDYSGEPQAVYDLTHTFKLEASKKSHRREYESQLAEYAQKLKALAEDGNNYAQARYAMMLESDLIEQSKDHYLDWYYRAARNGNYDAQLWMVRCFEYGTACKADKDKAFSWLELASNSGNERAQYQLATKLLDYETIHYDLDRAAEILRKATHNQYLPAMIAYAKLLAFADKESIRNYEEAVKYAELARSDAPDNPVLLSVLGVAYSELGRMQQGEKYLRQAYDEAKRRNWPTQNYLELMEGRASMMANGTSLIY
ncbi:TonB family protein [Pseudoalteromonas ruthenica]|uniref:TonB family protein n=1 Tax=Pseudoalteromonas ruthenica TaxID=151081 RepID=UPI00034BA6F7|nr:TonB family protein [Pseudoalteromonas ruthenica]